MKTLPAISKTLLSNAALGVVGVALVSTMVVRASSAAFTATTSNDNNSWDAGTVALTDNDAGAATFTAANLRPGDTATKCIQVTYGGSLTPSQTIKLHGVVTGSDGSGVDTGTAATLADNLDIAVTIYAATQTCATATPTEAPVYSGTLAGLPSGFAAGADSTWKPAGGANEVRAFELTYTVNANTGNDAQGDGAKANFVWEATS